MKNETIGNFRLVERIGAGGMGEVWVAEQKDLGTRVAIKLLLEAVSSDEELIQRFFNEARAVSRIEHAGIVKISDAGYTTAGRAYLVMELLRGEPLAKVIQREKKLSIAQLAEIGSQIASILRATHDQGITHRDLKPDNIFLVPDQERASGVRARILDFGIAKLSGTLAANAPETQGTMGTPPYMAPEQWADAGAVDHRADFYSLGCVLFEMAAGRPPFVALNMADYCNKHVNVPPPKVSELAPGMPPKLDAIVARLLAKQPADRGDSLEQVRTEIASLGDGAVVLSPLITGKVLAVTPEVAPTMPPDQPTVMPPEPQPPESTSDKQTVAHAIDKTVAVVHPPVDKTVATDTAGETMEVARPSNLPVVIGALGVVAVSALVAVLATRSSSNPAAADKPTCESVASHAATMVRAAPKLRDKAQLVVRSVFLSRCTVDAWSPETIACMANADAQTFGRCIQGLGSAAEVIETDLEREAARVEADWVVAGATALKLVDNIEFDGDQVREEYKPLVAAVAHHLLQAPRLTIEIGAYVTDDTGDLSTRRAMALRDILVALGVPEARLLVKGYGAHPPDRIVLGIR